MTTKEFLNLLDENADKELVFEYRKDQFVPAAYHITEVKNVHIDSVDCGGRPSESFETVVQLWISGTEVKDKGMSAGKALKIFEKVDSIKPLRYNTDLFIEWGDENLPTSNYAIEAVDNGPDKVTLKLFVPATACKPRLELSVLGNASKGCC